MHVLAHEAPPAGGAEFWQVLVAAGMAAVVFVPVLLFAVKERAGRPNLLGRLADRAAQRTGLPRWAALPMGLAGLSGFAALVGVYWDVPIHMELGRDEGPLANPSHFPIYFGLMGIMASGLISAALAKDPLPTRTLRITKDWRVPMGSVQMTATGLVGVAGFPLDDVWHRLFGQDVTEWGPTHILMIGGGVGVVIGLQLLLAEARQVGAHGRLVRLLGPVLAGAWLMGASTFLMEFDLGVPQFPMLAQVVLVGLIGAWTLTVGRLSWGPGGTLIVLAVLLGSRVLYSAIPALADLHVAVPLPYVAEAVIVEAAALFFTRWRFALVAGVGAGTVGMLGEAALSRTLMPNPWPSHQLVWFVAYGTAAAVAGALIGVWQHERVEEVADRSESTGPRHLPGLVGALAAVGLMASVAVPQDPKPMSGTLTLAEAGAGFEVSNPNSDATPKWVHATVRLEHPVDNPVWLNGFAWQGGDFATTPLHEVGDGVYRTAQPLPVYGQWKSGVRLHTPDGVMAILPIYAPADPAAGAAAIEARDGARAFMAEIDFLQRERKSDTPAVLWAVAYVIVGLIFAGMWILFAWLYANASRVRGLHRAV
ncbi:hypothetical protein GCM10010492_67410 [Saccharothrix mutabilis subsp. mutabilis]|uniref:ABC transporter permease n=1 Tax=Saccharothrix mutabilis subsp. mutabilis TaxID=66855 RepID=A0ABP3E9Z6_9PSEU